MNQYICPMHEEIQSSAPGDCPKCGMALEPLMPSVEEVENIDLLQFQRKFWITFPLSVFSVLLALLGESTSLLTPHTSSWFQMVLSIPVVLWAGKIFFLRCWQSIQTRNPNMWTLIGIGIGSAFVYSVVATIFPEIFPESFKTDGSVAVYFEAANVIVTLTILGQILELKSIAKTSSAIKSLLNMRPKSASRLVSDSEDEIIPIDDIQVGDSLRIRPGEAIPVDGVILEGQGAIDESMLTGEPIPVQKTLGDFVLAGSINSNGALIIQATKVGMNTVLSQIIEMVASAQRSKAPMQRMADVVSKYFVLAVIGISIATFFAWGILGTDQSWSHGLINAVAVLIIACPCALGLATPMSIMVASGRGAVQGVLFKDASTIETFRKINTLIVDKTGTLTEGRPELKEIINLGSYEANYLLQMAASLEVASEHPLAKAIVRAAKESEIDLVKVVDFVSVTGRGVEGIVGGKRIAIASIREEDDELLQSFDITDRILQLRNQGATVMVLTIDSEPNALIALSDRIKLNTLESLRTLKEAGINVIMATGDNQRTAEAIGVELGIKEIYGDVRPEDKLQLVAELQSQGLVVGMAGDGVNDAPALAKADVGIAMGTGTDVAMNSGGVTLVKGDLRGIAIARAISESTVWNMRQNLSFAFLYNSLGVPIAAGILYPLTGTLLSPMIAAFAMSLSSTSVVLNSLRLRDKSISAIIG
ncbi:MAG: copper-translocating P-type ATPase [Actinomycetes bacterium]